MPKQQDYCQQIGKKTARVSAKTHEVKKQSVE